MMFEPMITATAPGTPMGAAACCDSAVQAMCCEPGAEAGCCDGDPGCC